MTTGQKERRAWGTGRLFKRKRSRFWYIRYYDARGRRRTEATRTASRSEAERILRDRLARKDRGELVLDARRVTYAELADMLVKDYEVNGRRSLKRARVSLAQLERVFGGSRALAITPDRITAYIAERQSAGAANATIQNELATLKRMFNLGVQAGRLASRPHVPSVKVSNARQGFFEDADFKAVLAELPEYLRAPMHFGYCTGWRVQSEVLPLTWAQVDLDAGIVRLEPGTTKNDEGRAFPFDALPALKALLDTQRERTTALEKATGAIIPWVFHRDGRTIVSYRRAWASACKRAKVAGRIVHDLRRTAVRNLERAGVPRSVAMKLTGHKTESVYRRYAIVAEADLREGVSKLAALKTNKARTLSIQRTSGA